ncbi:MAG: hypothetical protein H6597_03105 [Flavobacteriales bacterium]|nr:hypothetical protein [Flavobacteriales bacterium]MCB9193495.1 hypothetical protein [Flavobacteriales bacterium]
MRTTLTLIALLCTIGVFAQGQRQQRTNAHEACAAPGPATERTLQERAVVWDFPKKAKEKKGLSVDGEGPRSLEPGDINLLFHGMGFAEDARHHSR